MYKLAVRARYAVPKLQNLRCFSAARPDEPLFPKKEDFPNRHIGPRDRDIVTMLDLLGYKVGGE